MFNRLRLTLSRRNKIMATLLIILGLGFALPEPRLIPVVGASPADWNPKSFWFEPWGKSGVHKGIDIFGKKGTQVLSATHGLVIFSGNLERGGKVVLLLGPSWRFHYYAHLNSIETRPLRFVSAGEPIATLGDTGNAQGKAPHLHYSILRIIPLPWLIDTSTQGYKKALYVDPGQYLSD